MYTNELLKEKYKAQKKLSQESGESIASYMKTIHLKVLKIKKQYKLNLKYKSIL